MSRIKWRVGDVFEFQHSDITAGDWWNMDGAIGIIVRKSSCDTWGVNWLSSPAPHLNSRKEWKDYDNIISMHNSVRITHIDLEGNSEIILDTVANHGLGSDHAPTPNDD